jgi:hypothetical protein
MVKLRCLNSVSQWEHEQVFNYPEIEIFVQKLKDIIKAKPGAGLNDPLLSESGKIIPCRKQSVNIALFSNRYAIGYNYLTASYIYNDTDIVIVKMKFT